MRLAAIDPGRQTAIAVARVTPLAKTVSIEPLGLHTLLYPPTTPLWTNIINPLVHCVVVEDTPILGHAEGKQAHSQVMAFLKELNFVTLYILQLILIW